jgi:hypothetical protein
MINPLLDTVLDRTVIGGYTNIGSGSAAATGAHRSCDSWTERS